MPAFSGARTFRAHVDVAQRTFWCEDAPPATVELAATLGPKALFRCGETSSPGAFQFPVGLRGVSNSANRIHIGMKRRKNQPGDEITRETGDAEGLSDSAESSSQSVAELLDEGQSFEASVLNGIENAPNADGGPIKIREVREDDVPAEYIDDEEPPGR